MENGEFRLGSSIWPGIASVNEGVDEETSKSIHQVVVELAEYVARGLDQAGFPRFLFPLFRPFNGIFALSDATLMCVTSPLRGGVASLKFLDVRTRQPPVPGLQDMAAAAERQLGWDELTLFEIPASLLVVSTQDRRATLSQIAATIVEEIRGGLAKEREVIEVRPIFHTKLENMRLRESLCFVLMPFRAQFDRIFQRVIGPAVSKCGLEAVRADQIFSPSNIVEDIWANIATARLLIADVTGKNPNVFYELGVAHTLGKRVIIVTQNEEDVPFDIGHIRFFRYTDDEAGWKRLDEALVQAIQSVMDEPD